MKIQVVAAVALALTSVAFAQQAVQWRLQDGGNGHWYAPIRPTPMPQDIAGHDAAAAALGAEMATMTSASENQFVISLLPNIAGEANGVYFGLRRQGVSWVWADGQPLTWNSWGNNYCASGPYPNNWINGGEMVGHLYRQDCGWIWDDTPPSWFVEQSTLRLLLEWSADCNGDGIVDYGQCRDGSLPDYNGNNVPDCCESGTPCEAGSFPVQWRMEDGGNAHWYQSLQCPGCCFSSAVQSARNVGAHLATLTTAGEQARLIPVIPVGQAAKLGGFRSPDSDKISGWQWMTGEEFSPPLVSWAEGNPGCCGPSQFWLYLQNTPGPGTGLHDGFDCSPTGADLLLLEWSADCNGDGIVDYGQILQGQVVDSDQDGIPDICQVPMCEDADLFRDFDVNGADLGILLSQWGPNTPLTVSDLNSDGVVNGADLGLLLSFWGACPN